jgi:hypothetical protein
MISKGDRLREYNVQCQSILLHNNVQTHILSVEVYDEFLQVMWTIPYTSFCIVMSAGSPFHGSVRAAKG